MIVLGHDHRVQAYGASVSEKCRQQQIRCLMIREVIRMRSLLNNELMRRLVERMEQQGIDMKVRRLIESSYS